MSKLVTQAPILLKQVIEVSKPKLNTFWKYAKVELAPPSLNDIPRIQQGLGDLVRSARTGRWKQLTIREAWLNVLIGSELFFVFFIGECIGKRHLVGYHV